MKAKMLIFMTLLFSASAWSQTTVTGTVTDKASGEGMPGVAVVVDGSGQGVFTGLDGSYTVTADPANDVLIFSFVGFSTLRVALKGATSLNASLESGVSLDEVVVTALGVTREKKSLGYSVQELGSEAFTEANADNIVRSLSGKVAGVQVTSGTSMGSSSKVLLRGASSITGDNQPLFVVNGIPMDNSDYSSTNTQRSVGGYDYGNAIQDVNPDDIESVTVLKGPAAAALYGARAANGAIVITTKNGKGYQAQGKRGLGVSINTGVEFNNVYILPEYQNRYGGGAGTAWIDTVDGAFIPDYGYDGSWGPELLGQEVRHWDSWEGENTGEVRGWSPTDSDVEEYFQTGITYRNNFAVTGATDASSFRLSYTKHDQTGVYENSSLNRNTLSFSSSSDVSDKLTVSANVNYVQSEGEGRPNTGYGTSIMSQFTQWGQRQLSMDRLRDYMNPDGSQRTWNRNSATDATPHYWDNPFWERYQNVQDDQRDRVYGNLSVDYTINDNLSMTARAMTDFYTDRRQERIAVGGVNESSYSEYTRQLQENNLDLFLNYKKDISDDLSLVAFVGLNQRTRDYKRLGAFTLGGLNTPGLYTVGNGVDGYQIDDYESHKAVNSVLGSMSFGYQNKLYLDITGRNDISSTLPNDNNSYFYPSATASYVFSEGMDSDILSFGKLRLGWAQVGNDTDPYETGLTYGVDPNFGSNGSAYVPNAQNNPGLRPEKTSSFEVGVDMNFFMDRLRLDMTYYNSTTEDLIFNVPVSGASGYTSAVLNAGETNNKGVEIALGATPVMTDNFRWDISVNLAKNKNELISLSEGIESLTYATLFGVSLQARPQGEDADGNITPGDALGTFYGYDFLYDDDGNKLVDGDGYYLSTDEVVNIGSILPDYTGGVYNALSFGNIRISALIDFQKGGSLHSYSNQWGKYSGTLAETALDDMRQDDDGDGISGIIVDGMTAVQNAEGVYESTGEANASVISAEAHFFYNQGYVIHAADQYDASFVKLREMRLDYDLPADALGDLPFYNVSIGVYGRNLALLHSNAPHIDPEVTTSASNIQGFEGGQLPAERTIGINLKLTL